MGGKKRSARAASLNLNDAAAFEVLIFETSFNKRVQCEHTFRCSHICCMRKKGENKVESGHVSDAVLR